MSLHKHRSRVVTDGLARAPHRAFLRATGLDDRDVEKSFVGIVTTAGENTPCSMSLQPQADQTRLGVAAAGGVVPPELLALDNVLLTPHLGTATRETRGTMGAMVIQSLIDHFSGRSPQHCVI